VLGSALLAANDRRGAPPARGYSQQAAGGDDSFRAGMTAQQGTTPVLCCLHAPAHTMA
jgi:hypothetical protein